MPPGKRRTAPRASTAKSPKAAAKLQRLLAAQLSAHLEAHLDAGGRAGPMRAEEVLESYVLGLGPLALNGFSGLQPAGTIVLATSPAGTPLHVEIEGSGKQRRVARVGSGAIAEDLQRAIAACRKTRRAGAELRILRIAALHFSAVWLHFPKQRARDVMAPYTPNFTGLRLGRTYPARRCELTLQKQATHTILLWYERQQR